MRARRVTLISVTLAALGAGAFIMAAGPLDPPPGLVKATGPVHLNEQWTTLPYTISKPGSYLLTSNLTGVPGQHGVVIAADGVTLDLNGFALIGVPGSSSGVYAQTAVKDLHVRNGTVQSWGGAGVHAGLAQTCVIDEIRAESNVEWGICVGNGEPGLGGGVIRNCVTRDNEDGILGYRVTVTSCTATSNRRHGIDVVRGVVTDCTASHNGNIGIWGTYGTSINMCAATKNGDTGINAWYGSSVSQSTAYENTGYGISGNDSLIRGCTAVDNGTGNIISTVCTVMDNHAP